MRPIDVGRRKLQSPYPLSGPEPWITRNEGKDALQSVDRHDAGATECAPDVLVMDRPVDKADHSAESGGEATRFEMAVEELQQLWWTHRRELFDTDFVGTHDSTLEEALDQSERAEFFVAHHVCDHVLDAPSIAEAGCHPLFGCQRLKERCQVDALLAGHLLQRLLFHSSHDATAVPTCSA